QSAQQSPEERTDGPPKEAAAEWEDAPTDGTWAGGDVAFGRVRELSGALSGYAFAVRELPTLTTADGEEVTVTGEIDVERGAERSAREVGAEHLDVAFHPGGDARPRSDEVYERTVVDCSPEVVDASEVATCTVSFTATAREVPNFFWVVNGLRTAA